MSRIFRSVGAAGLQLSEDLTGRTVMAAHTSKKVENVDVSSTVRMEPQSGQKNCIVEQQKRPLYWTFS